MTEHTFWDELAAGYALHSLSPDEETMFVVHLDSCDECTASLKDHTLVAAQLGSIAHYRESDEDEAPSWDLMRRSIVGAPTGSAGLTDDVDTTVVDLASRRRQYTSARRLLAAAAVVAVLAGGGVAAVRLTGGSSCSGSSGCHTVKLDASGGKMEAAVVVQDADVTVTPSGMAPAPSGKVYVLWQLPRNGPATAITSFTAGSKSATKSVGLPAAYSDTSGFAISEEDAAAAPYSVPSNTLASGSAT